MSHLLDGLVNIVDYIHMLLVWAAGHSVLVAFVLFLGLAIFFSMSDLS